VKSRLLPLAGGSTGWTLNVDGYLTYSPDGQGTNNAYLQVFRNGAIESV
jgi:hypothetical protein